MATTERTTRARSSDAASRDVHKDAVRIPFADLTSFLKDHLGPAAVSIIAGGADAKTIAGWAKGQRQPKDPAIEPRLRSAYQIFQLIQTVEAPQTIRAWFLGMNPQLEDLAPVQALAADQQREVLSAARAFVAGG